jgi:hypothetical protein
MKENRSKDAIDNNSDFLDYFDQHFIDALNLVLGFVH